jgi:predicted ABC-type ATPase
MEFVMANPIQIIFLKSHVKQFTRKDGTVVKEHDDKRQKKVEAAPTSIPAAKNDDSGKPPARDAEEVRGSAHGYGTHNMEEGDSIHFKAGEFAGSGTIKLVGKDGATVTDESGRDHNVHWHEITGFKANRGDGGGKKPPEGGDKPTEEGAEPEKEPQNPTILGKQDPIPAESFNAANYAKSHDQSDVSVDSVLSNFPGDTKEKIAKVVERLGSVEQTIDKMKNDPVYKAKRAILHAQITAKMLSPERVKAATPEEGRNPIFSILGGRGGSGKSALTKSVEKGGLGLVDKNKFIVLDADAIKEMLPEYEGWNAWQVHEESSELFNDITNHAQALGLNICHDATMKTPEKAVALIDRFNDAGYDTEAHYMHLPRQEAAKRAVGRFLGKSGRYVPLDVILDNTKNESSFDQLKNKVGRWTFHDNNVAEGDKPILISRYDKKETIDEEKPMTKSFREPIILLWRKVK